jgi:multicomponent Na+:H+ antiporter subunit D
VGVILASSLLTAVYFFRIIEKLFAVPSGGDPAVEKATEPSSRILVPILILAAGIIILGLANALIVNQLLMPVVNNLP